MYVCVYLNPGGRNANFWCVGHHVCLLLTSWTVWLQWSYDQPAARCSLICHHTTTTPGELDVIVVRKEGAANSHRDIRVRWSVVLCALQWLLVTNLYYHKIHIDPHTLSLLSEDGDMTELISVTTQSTSDDQELQSAEGVDLYDAHLSRTFDFGDSTQRLRWPVF